MREPPTTCGPSRWLAQSQLMLGDMAAALDAADRALALAEPMGFGVLIWQLRRVRGLALEELGDPAADAVLAAAAVEFETLADRIADPDLRTWFEGQRPRTDLLTVRASR